MTDHDWPRVRLASLIKVKHGFAFKGEFFVDGPTENLLVTPGNFAIGGGFQLGKPKYYNGPIPAEYVLEPGSLVVTMTDLSKAADTLGYGAVIPRVEGMTFLHNQRIGLVEVKSKDIDQSFLHYLLRTHGYRQHIVGSASGSTVKHTSPGRIEDYQFDLPPKAMQVRIGEVLCSLDDRITLLRETNATLEAIALALFKSWFVDFDPVRAKAEGREPEGVPLEVVDLFPNELVGSELGMIPKGWKAGKLGEVITILDSRRVPLSKREREQRKGSFPYYGAASIMDYVDGYLFDGVHVLVGEDGSVINQDGTPVIQYAWGKYWVNNHAHVLAASGPACLEHIMLALKQQNITPFVTGAVQPKLNQGNMVRIPFLISPPEIAVTFSNMLQPVYAGVRHNSDRVQNLAELRDTLLPRLMSGKLRIAEAEKELEAV